MDDNNIPILIDTEPETSIEVDGEERINTVASNANNCTKTLYNITMDNFTCVEEHESVEYKDLESRLQLERKDWKSLLHNICGERKKAKEKLPAIGKSILPPEKRTYLEHAPCLQTFIRESLEFREDAHCFLEFDYMELMETVGNLEDLCERRMNQVKTLKQAENLANYGGKRKD